MNASQLAMLASSSVNGCLVLDEAPWPEPTPVPTACLGTPATQLVPLVDTPEFLAGLWRCTPGEFRSVHQGYLEYLHVLEGVAELRGDNGVVWPLGPGTSLVIPDGWEGLWQVTSTVVKSFAIFRLPPEGGGAAW